MDDHMQVLAEKMGVLADGLTKVYQFLEPVRIEVYGDPGDRAMEMDKPLVEAGSSTPSSRATWAGSPARRRADRTGVQPRHAFLAEIGPEMAPPDGRQHPPSQRTT
jgi:hypothetical protein